MTQDNATQIAKLYVERTLKKRATIFEVLRCPEDDVRSKYFEFTTEDEETIEVCISPRDVRISSTTRYADGSVETHSCPFRKVEPTEIFK